jgi:hypothetical protein
MNKNKDKNDYNGDDEEEDEKYLSHVEFIYSRKYQ